MQQCTTRKSYRWLPVFLLLLNGTVLACNEAAGDSSRIAIAGGSLTEIIYFLGAQNRIVATDRTSNFPHEARDFPSVGYVRNLSAEGLLSLNPSLILGEQDMGSAIVLKQVARTGVEIIRVPEQYTAKGIVEKVRCIARVLNMQPIAEKKIAEYLDPLLASLAMIDMNTDAAPPRVALLLGLPGGMLLVAGSTTPGDGLLTMINAENIFSDINGWKPVSIETMVRANPDYIIISQRSMDIAGGRDAVAAHPAIRLTAAGRDQRVIAMDGMTILGFGPRTLQAALQLANILHKQNVANTGSELIR